MICSIQSFIRRIKIIVIIALSITIVSVYSLPFGGTWKLVGMVIDGTAVGDEFGRSVAMSADGTTIIIGASRNTNIFGTHAGLVRIYTINSTSGNWQQLGSDIIGKAAFEKFGWSVCISEDGRIIAAGAPGNNEIGSSSGQVRVYSYNSITAQWVQVGSDINGEADSDNSGWSVDMSADGKTIVIGAPFNSNIGHARVYSINATSSNWTQVGADIDGESVFDSSGVSVAMSSDGKIIAIGAPYNAKNGFSAGHVRVFANNYSSRNWTQLGSDINGKVAYSISGASVAISSDGKTIAIGANGYVCVYTINGTSGNWTQIGLDIDGLSLGNSVAMSSDGKTVAIGAPLNNNIGHVRVFSINSTSGKWTQVGLDISGNVVGALSGHSIAISNDGYKLAIGAPFNSNINGTLGQVHVYKYELQPTKAPTTIPTKSPTNAPTRMPTMSSLGGTWKQVGFDIDGEALNDLSGYSVAMAAEGKTIVVGAPNSGSGSGQVRVYSINSTTSNWQQIGSDINGKAAMDSFGSSVSISDDGKTFAAGAPGNDDVNGVNSGQVRVFSLNIITQQWEQVGSDINGERGGDQSGWAVDMSADGKTIAIGAFANSNPNGVNSGHVRVYSINTISGNWTQVGADIDGKAMGDQSGHAVALSSDGKIIAIGSPYNDNENGVDAGHVRVFSNNFTTRNWTQVGSDIVGKALRINSGYSVAISSDGKTIAIGAPFNNVINSNVAGHVRVYTINGTSGNWTQVGLDIDGLSLDDRSGYSVALSADGKTVAIGAPFNDNAIGTNTGHVRVFSINSTSGNWAQVGSDIHGEAQFDGSGFSVALSNDGLTLAIGAPYNDNANSNSVGHVRVYKFELPPTKAPTRMPTKSPTKAPSITPMQMPTKAPTKSPTKFSTRRPTNNPTKSPSKFSTKNPTENPTKRTTSVPTKSPSNMQTEKPMTSPTKSPSQITLPVPITPVQVSTPTPVSAPTNCGLFGLNFFCPRRGECGFLRRLLNLHGC